MTEDFEAFLRERRERAERTGRLLVVVLSVTCVALAVSNVVLALRLTGTRAHPVAEAPARPATGAPAPSASIPMRAEGPPPTVTLPTTREPAQQEPADPRGAAVPGAEPARSDTPPPTVPDRPSGAVELPSRPFVGAAPTRRVASPRATTATPSPSSAKVAAPSVPSAPAPTAREEATAAWMLTTYGRPVAEARALAALEFYDAESAEGRYWRRVLALLTTAR
jgi:hypothetical protein